MMQNELKVATAHKYIQTKIIYKDIRNKVDITF